MEVPNFMESTRKIVGYIENLADDVLNFSDDSQRQSLDHALRQLHAEKQENLIPQEYSAKEQEQVETYLKRIYETDYSNPGDMHLSTLFRPAGEEIHSLQ